MLFLAFAYAQNFQVILYLTVIVVGGNVKIGPALIAQGGLTVKINEYNERVGRAFAEISDIESGNRGTSQAAGQQ